MPSFEKFANKLRETFDEGATQFRVVRLQMLLHLEKIVAGATYKELELEFKLTN